MSDQDLPLVLHTRVVTGAGGGPEKTILNSPRFLPPLGYRSICAYMHPPGDAGFEPLRQRANEWEAPLLEIDDGGPLDWNVYRRYLDICRQHRVTIWHGHDYKSNLIGLWVNRYWPMKLVTTVHGWVKFTWRTPVYYAIDRFCLRRYERVICVSDDLETACLQAGVRRERCVWIENAIDTTQFQRKLDTASAKRALGFSPERTLIGGVGRLSAEKGFDILIESIAKLRQRGCLVDLVLVGEGDQQAAILRKIEQLQLGEQVRLLGFRTDTIVLYQAFDLFALSSYREGLPNVVLEAMALETPVVATAVNGVPKLITHERNGMLVSPGDAEGMAVAVQRVLSDEPFRKGLIRQARETIEERFSFHRRMEKVAAVYDDVLRRSK